MSGNFVRCTKNVAGQSVHQLKIFILRLDYIYSHTSQESNLGCLNKHKTKTGVVAPWSLCSAVVLLTMEKLSLEKILKKN